MDVLRYFSLDLSAGLLMNNISLQVVLGCFFCSVQYSILIILFEDVASVSVNVYWLVVRCTFACVCVLFFFFLSTHPEVLVFIRSVHRLKLS